MAGGNKGGKGRKIGRNEGYCKLYTAADLWAKNQKRRMRRHLLSHPRDTQAIAVFEKTYGKVTDLRVVVKGKSTDRAVNSMGRRKISRYQNTTLQLALFQARTARRLARRTVKEKQAEQEKQQSAPVAVATS